MHTYNSQLKDSLTIGELTYEDPTGITGVVSQMLIAGEFPSASTWVSIPHYVATPPNPKGQHAPLSRTGQILGASLGAGDLLNETGKWVQAVDKLSTKDPDVAEYIERLEETHGASDVEDATGNSVITEFERYLRDRDDEPG